MQGKWRAPIGFSHCSDNPVVNKSKQYLKTHNKYSHMHPISPKSSVLFTKRYTLQYVRLSQICQRKGVQMEQRSYRQRTFLSLRTVTLESNKFVYFGYSSERLWVFRAPVELVQQQWLLLLILVSFSLVDIWLLFGRGLCNDSLLFRTKEGVPTSRYYHLSFLIGS